jgi:hypothetical protein
MATKSDVNPPAPSRMTSSALVDTRVIYCGDNLEQLPKLPDACVDVGARCIRRIMVGNYNRDNSRIRR